MMQDDNPYRGTEVDLSTLLHVLMHGKPGSMHGTLKGYSAAELEAIGSKAGALTSDTLSHLSNLGRTLAAAEESPDTLDQSVRINMGWLTKTLADLANLLSVLEANARHELSELNSGAYARRATQHAASTSARN
jgi:hypothetical protein